MIDDGYNHLNDCDDGTHRGAAEPPGSRCRCCGKPLHEMSLEHVQRAAQAATRATADPVEEFTEEDRQWARDEQADHISSDRGRWRWWGC